MLAGLAGASWWARPAGLALAAFTTMPRERRRWPGIQLAGVRASPERPGTRGAIPAPADWPADSLAQHGWDHR